MAIIEVSEPQDFGCVLCSFIMQTESVQPAWLLSSVELSMANAIACCDCTLCASKICTPQPTAQSGLTACSGPPIKQPTCLGGLTQSVLLHLCSFMLCMHALQLIGRWPTDRLVEQSSPLCVDISATLTVSHLMI